MAEDVPKRLRLVLKCLAHGPVFTLPSLAIEQIVVNHLAPCAALQAVRGHDLLDPVQVCVEGDVAYTELG